MTNLLGTGYIIYLFILISSLLVLIFDYVLTVINVKEEYFKEYETLVSYIKTIAIGSFLVMLLFSDFLNYLVVQFFPKTVKVLVTPSIINETDTYMGAIKIFAYMPLGEYKELHKDDDGKFSGEIKTPYNERKIYISAISNDFWPANRYDEIEDDNFYKKEIKLYPKTLNINFEREADNKWGVFDSLTIRGDVFPDTIKMAKATKAIIKGIYPTPKQKEK